MQKFDSATREKQENKNFITKSYDSAAHGILSELHKEVHFDILKFLMANSCNEIVVATDVEVHLH